MDTFINLVYIAAAILFIFGIKMLGSARTARRGNALSSLGMFLAIVVTLMNSQIISFGLLAVAILIGAVIGAFAARLVKMTAMPEMVALFNGFGGLASMLVGWAEFQKFHFWYTMPSFGPTFQTEPMPTLLPQFTAFVIVVTILIGGITFTGSIYAWAKLSGRVSGRPTLFSGQQFVNAVLACAVVILGILFTLYPDSNSAQYILIPIIVIPLVLGVLSVMPIGGGDMPVVISLLNSLSGLAACAAGFVIANNVLIVAGCLVGASGLILTVIMCKAMNRTLGNVLFSGFGATQQSSSAKSEGELKPISADDAYYILEAAKSVVVIPGYGMAVAQAQHAVKELGELLENNGTELRYAIHPVAGRMPGHMNVLLAEADVPYEQLVEMDDVNPTMEHVDVAIVIGANDVVNPAAQEDSGSPIYGMPIIEAQNARTVFCLKRGQGTGFSGLQNTLFTRPNTRMLYGDAKSTVTELVVQFKES